MQFVSEGGETDLPRPGSWSHVRIQLVGGIWNTLRQKQCLCTPQSKRISALGNTLLPSPGHSCSQAQKSSKWEHGRKTRHLKTFYILYATQTWNVLYIVRNTVFTTLIQNDFPNVQVILYIYSFAMYSLKLLDIYWKNLPGVKWQCPTWDLNLWARRDS